MSLKERMVSYELISNALLTKKLPVIISLNGRSFRKLTSLLTKPYCNDFSILMGQILICLMSEIEGSVFGYSYNDEIHIVCRNDQTLQTEAWYGNDIQKIVSASASLASISLFSLAKQRDIKLLGNPVFLGKTFILPSIAETINYLISKQNQASNSAIHFATYYELLKIHNTPDKVLQLMRDLNTDEKYELLMKQEGVNLNQYGLAFWRGIGCYRVPTLINNETKYKLTINDSLPFLSKDQTFLSNILNR